MTHTTEPAVRDHGRLRYLETSDPGPEGFTGPRERGAAPARRRRRGDRQP